MNNSRPAALQEFIEACEAVLAARRGVIPEADAAASRIFAALETAAQPGGGSASRLPVCRMFAEVAAAAEPGPPGPARLARALAALEPQLAWTRSARGSAEPGFFDGHANAYVIGPEGLEVRDDVMIGVSLMAPQVRYPDHRHPPEEVYVALSPGEWRQGDGAWFEPGLGGILYNSPDIVHAMRSGDRPLLAVWALWNGAA